MGLWRAVAGMAAAVALAMLMVAGTLSTQLATRREYNQRRIAHLRHTLAGAQAELDAARKQAAGLRGHLESRAGMTRVLLAPDALIIRLEADLSAASKGPTAISRGAHRAARGLVALSATLRLAAFEAYDLPPTPPGMSYDLWWVTAGGAQTRAASFKTGHEGDASLNIATPPGGDRLAVCLVTLEPDGLHSKPTGPIYLRGDVSRSESVRSLSGKLPPSTSLGSRGRR